MKIKNLIKRTEIIASLVVGSIGLEARVDAGIIPADFFASDAQKINQLSSYDSVVATPNWDDYYGNIKWDNFQKDNVNTGYRIWTLDANKKPCGVFNIKTNGVYGFLHSYKDDLTTSSIDEGALAGDLMNVIVQEISTNKMYNAQFTDSNYNPVTVSFQGDKGRYNNTILTGSQVYPIEMYWDKNSSSSGAGSNLDGNWTDNFWNLYPDGTGTTGNWMKSTAVFSAGDDATGNYTVNINGNQQINGLKFKNGFVTLNSGNLELIADSSFDANSNTNINSNLTGIGKLTKTGTGTIVLSGSNNYSGGTSVNNGILEIENANSLAYGNLVISGNGHVILDSGLSHAISLGGLTITSGTGSENYSSSIENNPYSTKITNNVPEPSGLELVIIAATVGALTVKRIRRKNEK